MPLSFCHDGSRGANFSSHSQNSGDDPKPDYRVAIQPFCDFHDGSLSDQGDTGTIETTSGGAPSPVAGGARTFVLRYSRIPTAGRYLYHNAPRSGGQSPLRLLFYSAPA